MTRQWGRRIFVTGLGMTGLGIGSISAAHWREGPSVGESASTLRALPLNAIGIAAHYAASIPVPHPLRRAVYQSYCSAVNCDVTEVDGSLTDFESLAEFFARGLRPECRPVAEESQLVMPCDGIIVAAGPVGAYGSIRVKNAQYRIRELMGGKDREPLAVSSVSVDERAESGSRLWYTVIHIQPGDCHRFASPATWRMLERRRIEGHLLWLNPGVESLYTENERVAMVGEWDHGLFSMAAVGAAGRGSIKLDAEEDCFRPQFRPTHNKITAHKFDEMKLLVPGQSVGGFRLGSAIVLVFEAPEKSFRFLGNAGDYMKLGQKLATFAVPNETTKPQQATSSIPLQRNLGSRAGFRRAW